MIAAVIAVLLLFADGDSEFGLAKATLRANNPLRARQYFAQAAAKGHAGAMQELGVMMAEGKGGPRDMPGALQWIEKAAAQGDLHNAAAMYWLAESHYEAKELPQAAEWFRKSAEAGDVDAKLRFGFMLSHGEGVAQDTQKAFAMYLDAARAGNTAAMFNLGEYYNAGKGVEQSATAARFWYLRAAMNGETDAEAKFASLADAPSESTEGARLQELATKTRNSASTEAEFAAAKGKAFPIYLQAAELGHLPGITAVAYAYQHGDGIAKDLVKAREWTLISAEMGNDSSQTILAQFLLEGIGGPRNTQGARFWFEQAALAGNSLAMWKLARIYDGDYGLPPNDALASYWWFEAFKAGSPTAEKVLIDRGLIEKQRDPVARAFVARIDRDGPDRTSAATFTYDVAQYCKYDGSRCHELSVAARKFEQSHNAAADAANMARLWNAYAPSDPDADRKWRERSDCMKKKTESIQKHTYGQQDWYYSGQCY